MVDFYERVKLICHAQKTNVRELLKQVDMVYDTYKSARRYGHLPRADDAYRIAKALGVSVDYLIVGRDAPETPLLTDIYARLPGLTPQQQEAVLALIMGFSK
jgi:transcriptional regulator with XRE-family HTH domain